MFFRAFSEVVEAPTQRVTKATNYKYVSLATSSGYMRDCAIYPTMSVLSQDTHAQFYFVVSRTE